VLIVGRERLKDDRLENCETSLAHDERPPFFIARFCRLKIQRGRVITVAGLRSDFLTFHLLTNSYSALARLTRLSIEGFADAALAMLDADDSDAYCWCGLLG
tara:strand:- start:392 stop:697 length:306 start_codon:yes stop_codon:yes gene_type:complete